MFGTAINDKVVSPIKEETDKAISSLNANKSPDTGEFHPELYKSMREHQLPLLETCFK